MAPNQAFPEREPGTSRGLSLFSAVICGLFALYMAGSLYAVSLKTGPFPFDEFFALWSYAKIAAAHSAGMLYDHAALHAAQLELGRDPVGNAPFPYPPSFIFYLAPLAPFSYDTAYVIWIGATLGLYLLATAPGHGRFLTLGLPLLLAPTTTITIAHGQSGFLLAALLIGGVRLMERRPVISGILFGLATYKPQFGLLVPFALVAAGAWRALAAAVLSVVAIGLAASLAFGWSIWQQWLRALPEYVAWFDGLVQRQGPLMPSLSANLTTLGVPAGIVFWAQGAAVLFALAFVWIAFRRFPRDLAAPVLLVAAFIATPHAFIYDMPVLTGAVILFAAWRLRTDTLPPLAEVLADLLVLILPAFMVATNPTLPVSAIVICLFATVLAAAGTSPEAEQDRTSW